MNFDLSFMKSYDFNIDFLGKIKYFVDLKPPICSESYQHLVEMAKNYFGGHPD